MVFVFQKILQYEQTVYFYLNMWRVRFDIEKVHMDEVQNDNKFWQARIINEYLSTVNAEVCGCHTQKEHRAS